MRLATALNGLSTARASVSLIGDGPTDGRLHVIGVELNPAEVEVLSLHRELLSTVLVQEYARSGNSTVSAEVVLERIQDFSNWLRRQKDSEIATVLSGGTMADLAVAVVQDTGVGRLPYRDIRRQLMGDVRRAA